LLAENQVGHSEGDGEDLGARVEPGGRQIERMYRRGRPDREEDQVHIHEEVELDKRQLKQRPRGTSEDNPEYLFILVRQECWS
jgi:hypothetical protein